ncbi:hypothetical protein BH09PLA1_BH09PLA1_00800 [soil metagenome]
MQLMRFAVIIGAGLSLLAAAARAEVYYSVADLGDLGQHYARPSTLSDTGMLSGESFTAIGVRKGFFWSSETGIIDLIPPGNPGTVPEGIGYGVNDARQVVGYIRPDQPAPKVAFVWSATTGLQTIGTLGGSKSEARGINNFGQVTGAAVTANGTTRAFRWSATTGMQDLGTLGAATRGNAINYSGHVAGLAVVNGQSRAFRWRPDTGMTDIGTLGGISAEGHAINNRDQIAGESVTAEGGGNLHTHAFRWDPQTGMLDLGTLGGNGSLARGINDDGWVVGNSYLPSNEPPVHGFVHDGTSMRDLNDLIDPASGWLILDAHDINNRGQIAAFASRASEPWGHAVLLTPIPEPAAVALAVLAMPVLSLAPRGARRIGI